MKFLTGEIVSFNASNGSGLILADDEKLSSIRIFFHIDEFSRNSRPHVGKGGRVTFLVRPNQYVREDERVKPVWYIGTIKAVNCILHSDKEGQQDQLFLSVDEIVDLIPARSTGE